MPSMKASGSCTASSWPIGKIPIEMMLTLYGRSLSGSLSREVDYQQLDERKALTLAKKDQLLMLLSHPEMLLHNNPAERGG